MIKRLARLSPYYENDELRQDIAGSLLDHVDRRGVPYCLSWITSQPWEISCSTALRLTHCSPRTCPSRASGNSVTRRATSPKADWSPGSARARRASHTSAASTSP